MNTTLNTGRSGLVYGNTHIFRDVGVAPLLELFITFGAASLLSRTLKSRACLLHGVFNPILVICCQDVLPQLKGPLLVVILGSVVSQYLVQICLKGSEGKDINKGNVRSAAELETQENETKDDMHNSREESNFLQPMIFPSRTTHRRLFPTQHAFGYSYLLVGVPVSDTARMIPNPMLSMHPCMTPNHSPDMSQAWFSVNASDYLHRGKAFSNSNLRQKLDQYLETEGVQPDVYPHAFLVTAPRFLGFSFNPVSFWYLYDRSKALAAMMLEVNNTFDERRTYLLQRSQQPFNESASTEKPETSAVGKAVRFTQVWAKDFHVSPFNDRGGSYSVTVSDVAATQALDNTIVLRSEDDKPKIVARIYSTESGIDPASMSLWTRMVFLLRWFWVGFMTNPRILKEARILWVKKLQVFYRPEPLRSTIGRNETPEEVVVEEHFRRILNASARRAGAIVEYWPAAGNQREQRVTLGGKSEEIAPGTPVRLQVLTPEFYSELSREYGGIVSVFERICFQNSSSTQCPSLARNPLVWTDDEDAVRKLFSDGNDRRLKNPLSRKSSVAICGSGRLSQLEYAVAVFRKQEWNLRGPLLWILVRSLGFQCADQDFKLSEMDEEVKGFVDASGEYVGYLWSVLGILLIDRLAFGFRGLFSLELRAARFMTVMLAAQLVRLGLHIVLVERRALMQSSIAC